MFNRLIKSLVMFMTLLLVSQACYAGNDLRYEDVISKVELPVIFVSAGQSGGCYVTDALCERVGVPYDRAYEPLSRHLENGVGVAGLNEIIDLNQLDNYADFLFYAGYQCHSDAEPGTPYKTIVFVMGKEPDGFCSNGYVSIDRELERLMDNILWAEKNGLTIIGMHVEGKSMRNDRQGHNERIIDLVAPACDLILVNDPGDYDGKFTDIGHAREIPVVVTPNITSMIPVFQYLFDIDPES